MPHDSAARPFACGRHEGRIYSLPALQAESGLAIGRLPVCLRIVLESLLRHQDGQRVAVAHVEGLAGWRPHAPRVGEIPFVVARILLQDFTGVPVLCDLAALRGAAARLGFDPATVEPALPLQLVIDHSVQIDRYGNPRALDANMALEFQRNAERYAFIKWGMQAFRRLTVVPPGVGIVHQVNLELLARPLWQRDGVFFPDSLVGTDSHTTMINGLGTVGWGVGGIEAEAAMLGQPVAVATPDVVGVHLHGALRPGVTATDLVLRVTERLREVGVVGAWVEFHGAGAASLSVPDRATIANMAPEYGATMGYFPADQRTLDYLAATGREGEDIALLRAYLEAQGMFGMPPADHLAYTTVVDVDLDAIRACVAGPRQPQERVPLDRLAGQIAALLTAAPAQRGYGRRPEEIAHRHAVPPAPPGGEAPAAPEPTERAGRPAVIRFEIEMAEAGRQPQPRVPEPAAEPVRDIGDGDILIAAITSCTNTSNPAVMIAAGLLARRALAAGLRVPPRVKTSLAPGSRVVAQYLRDAGLLGDLERLGFAVAAYGCTTCIGNSGPLDPRFERAIAEHGLVCAAVLSGNRNFEARIHPAIRANFIMSPPLVVAFALAGRVGIDLEHEPLGTAPDGRPVHLRDIWPAPAEVAALLPLAARSELYRRAYQGVEAGEPRWNAIPVPAGQVHAWSPASTYIAEPPFCTAAGRDPEPLHPIRSARILAWFGDGVTTDHISPAGAIDPESPAGRWLRERGVAPADFNSYGSRRGHHEVMVRGTFANPSLRNRLVPAGARDPAGTAGCLARLEPEGAVLPLHDVAMRYAERAVPTIVVAGEAYGAGSSRDWAAKGTRLLGVRAVAARSFERIHRSNLVGMGVLPLQFLDPAHPDGLDLAGDELCALEGVEMPPRPRQEAVLALDGPRGRREAPVRVRLDTPSEVEHYRHGGVLPYALRRLLWG